MLWIWIQNLWFGSGTREKPSGYTTHEITIFNIIWAIFSFGQKTVYQKLRFHFDILRFYQDFTFLIFAVWFFIMGDAFHWTGGSHSRPFIPLCCFLMVLLLSCLGFCLSGSLPLQNFSQIVMVHFHSFVKRWDSTPL